ncbi:pyridoxal-phosphate dependent enzyme [Arsukibacterium sp.]|uniref:1-aminocyclopropane-1-carboxylate deaminase/D-cysteine desulfhydrase n=1 Tax=Arsukibacterium sp. TaxID=1977258 RepID=UPI001BD20C55|nr:pyridoxal-phosphate dependent enzyme [Arsukibacterium sp.]
MLLPTSDFAGLSAHWYRIADSLLAKTRVELWVYCPKTAEPMISGNKWMKLQYHIKLIQQQQYRGFVTFGGAFSNHLAACAAAAELFNIKATAYVRADTIDRQNPTLQFCLAKGMTLIATDRQTYRQREQADFLNMLALRHPDCLIIPEGGSSVLGASGIAGLNLTDTPAGPADVIATATASGGTLAGLITARSQQVHSNSSSEIIGLAVVNDPSLPVKVTALLKNNAAHPAPWRIVATAPDQRYAKCAAEHIDFCCEFALNHNIALEPVYTGRALCKLYQMIAAGEFAPGSRISFFHTGGLQGLAGLYYRQLINQQQYQILSAATVG